MKVKTLSLPGDIIVIPGHNSFTAVEYDCENKEYLLSLSARFSYIMNSNEHFCLPARRRCWRTKVCALADAISRIVRSLANLSYETHVILPLYTSVDRSILMHCDQQMIVNMDSGIELCDVWEKILFGVVFRSSNSTDIFLG
jgi:hypothetical protein